MANKWLTHVKKTMKQMKSKGSYKKGDGLKKVIMEAKKTYKKHGGAESESDGETPVVEGGKKKSRKTRRRRHH